MATATTHTGRFAGAHAASGLACALLVLAGVLWMEGIGMPGTLPTLPTFVLGDVFGGDAQRVLYGTLLLLLGCVGAAIFLPTYTPATEQRADAAEGVPPGLRFSVPRSRAAPASAVVAVVIYLWLLVRARNHALASGVVNYVVLLALAAAIALFGFSIHLATGRADEERSRPVQGLETLFVAALIVAFMALMVWDIRDWQYAFWGDEWPFYSLGRTIVDGAAIDPFNQAGVYGIHPYADSMYQALVMRIAGVNVTGWRLSGILATALPVAAIYALGRRIAGEIYAAVAALLYASCPLLWAFAHIGYNNQDVLLPMTVAALLCYRGIRAGSARWLFAAGAVAGACWYGIFTGRLMIGVLGLVLLTEWRGGWQATVRRIGVVIAGFVLTVLPLVIDNGMDTLHAMSHNTPMSEMHDYYQFVSQNFVRSLYAFLYTTTNNHYTLGAIFDPLAAAALCVGIALSLRRPWLLSSRMLLIWFAVTTAFTTTFNDSPSVSFTRGMVVIPPAALLAAEGLCAFFMAAQALYLGARHVSWLFLTGLGVVVVLVLDISLYQFYKAVPANRYPPFPQVDLIIKTIIETPNTVFVLPADMHQEDSNVMFCDVLNGFGVDPAQVLYFSGGQIVPFCGPSTQLPSPEPWVMIVASSQQAVAACKVSPADMLSEKQGNVWRFIFPVATRPVVNYAERLRARVFQVCPSG